MTVAKVDIGILNLVVVASSACVMQLEVIIMFVIIILDNVIANQESVVLNAINAWMDIMDFPKKDVEVILFLCRIISANKFLNFNLLGEAVVHLFNLINFISF